MAHDIAQINGINCFAYNKLTGSRPWHGLGQGHAGPMTIDKGLELVQGFNAVELPLHATNPETGQAIPVQSHKAIVRGSDHVLLGTVGSGYRIMQYEDVLKGFLEPLFGEDNPVLDTIGLLGKGERMFASVDQKPMIVQTPKGKDEVQRYLIVTSAHDGSGAVKVLNGMIRTVCQNTLNANLQRSKNTTKIRHTAGAPMALAEAAAALDRSHKFYSEARESFEKLAKEAIKTEAELTGYLERIFPFTPTEDQPEPSTQLLNAREQVKDYFEGGADGADLAGKSKWGLYNATTQWVDRDQPTRESNRWLRTTFNSTAEATRQRALNVLVGV